MKFNHLILLPLFFQLQALPTLASEIPSSAIKWPLGSEAIIDKAIAIKVETQKQTVTMRSKGGTAGHAFVKCMDELAAILSETTGIGSKLKEEEGRDLKVKIALWSLDRKTRPEEYARLEHLHVSPNPVGKAAAQRNAELNRPKVLDGVHPSSMSPKGRPPLPHVAHPPAVADEDAVEANRWIIEYLYFAPPTGENEWGGGISRYILSSALSKICDERTLVMLKFDLETQIEAFPDTKPGDGLWTWVGGDVKQVLDFRTPRAFSITASLMHHAGVRKHVRNFITFLSSEHAEYVIAPWRGKLDDYKNLANMEWKTDAEKELASWIKAIPPIMPPAR